MPDITVISKKTPKYLRPVEAVEYSLVSGTRKKPYLLDKRKKLTIGRLGKNDIRIPLSTVSDLHASIKWDKNGYVIQDENSTNGVFVNNKRIQKSAKLSDGDKIKIGRYVFKFMRVRVRTKAGQTAKAVKTAKKTTKTITKKSAKKAKSVQPKRIVKKVKSVQPKKSTAKKKTTQVKKPVQAEKVIKKTTVKKTRTRPTAKKTKSVQAK